MTRSTTTTTTSPATTAAPPAPSAQAERQRALAGEQLARDRWSRDRLLAYQEERLRALIAHAVAASPYYREVLGPDAASGDVPLQELPTLPKATRCSPTAGPTGLRGPIVEARIAAVAPRAGQAGAAAGDPAVRDGARCTLQPGCAGCWPGRPAPLRGLADHPARGGRP